MKTVFKYQCPLSGAGDFTIEMPVGAKVLCVQVQQANEMICALVDSDARKEPRRFHWRGTGHDAENVGRYVGTVQHGGGDFVFHLFEAKTLADVSEIPND